VKILALTAVNLNKKYISCVPYFIDFWLGLKSSQSDISFEPKVIVIANELPSELKKYSQWCELYISPTDLSSVFISQNIRTLQPSLESANYVITTDVDMLPLHAGVFHTALDEVSNGADIVICRDVLGSDQYPICYNVASPAIWKKITQVKCIEDIDQELLHRYEKISNGIKYEGQHGGSGWFTDQECLFEQINAFEKLGGRVKKLSDRETGHRRLDRLYHPFPINWLLLPLVSFGFFSDYHVHHPIGLHKRYVKAVLTLLKLRNRLTIQS
jgi:hypothetical protein